jgi:hypothetical protein
MDYTCRSARADGVRALDYFQIPEMPGIDRFACTRLHATLPVSACAAMWRQANEKACDRHITCRGCPLGAGHAGIPNASLSPIFGVLVCGRCHAGATRLVCGSLCVSCKNREYEIVRGRNARGQYPSRLPPLAARALPYWSDGRPQWIRKERTVSTTGLIVDLLRDARHQVVLGWRAQMHLALAWRSHGPSSRIAV